MGFSTETINLLGSIYSIPNNVCRDVAVDFGSCVGKFAVENHNRFDEMFCFEPFYSNFRETYRNVFQYPNIYPFPLAIGEKSGELVSVGTIKKVKKPNPMNCGIGEEGPDSHLVMSISLSDVLKLIGKSRISYLKCDIEASEYGVFIGKDLSSIDFLAIELHSNGRRKALYAYLLEFFDLIEQSKNQRESTHWLNLYRNKNFENKTLHYYI